MRHGHMEAGGVTGGMDRLEGPILISRSLPSVKVVLVLCCEGETMR